jgi:flagellar biosynthesis protein FliQ
MNELEALDLGREAIIVMLKISGPVLAVGLVVGVIVASSSCFPISIRRFQASR